MRHRELHLNGQTYVSSRTESLVECLDCGLNYINPRLASIPGLTAYNEADEIAYFEASYGARIKAYRQLLGRITGWSDHPTSSLLDIGCGDGALLEAAIDAGYPKVRGVEISQTLIERVRNRLGDGFAVGTGLADFRPEEFDVVALINVIEHLHQPGEMLEEAHRILKPGGILLVHAPNIGGIPARIQGARWTQIEPNAHFYYFTARTLSGLLAKTGFETVGRFHLNISSGLRALVQDGLATLEIYIDNGLGIAARKLPVTA